MTQLILVGLGGCLGAVARYGVGRLLLVLELNFPIATLLVNVMGAFLIGFTWVLLFGRGAISDDVRLFLMTGFLGAFTTFSAFSLDSLLLFEAGETVKAFLNIGLNVVLCLLFVWLGVQLARLAGI